MYALLLKGAKNLAEKMFIQTRVCLQGMLRSLTLSNELCNVMFKANQCLFQYGVSSSAGMSSSLDVTI